MSHELLIRTAARWKISRELALAVILRDDVCIYCRRRFEYSPGPRAACPSWEHIKNDLSLVDARNIALCCVRCNSSKGTKSLADWLNSNYCKERGITDWSMAPVASAHLAAMPSSPDNSMADVMSQPRSVASDLSDAGTILIPDAGIVLAAPYLPRLWSMLGLVKEQAFVDVAAAERAAHLMRFVVFGDTQPDEAASALNRLLCGLPLAASGNESAAGFAISAREREVIDGMLAAMIAQWNVLGHTSIEALRETFFQRKGRLVRGQGCWTLKVEPAALDMLLDRLPWGHATCRFLWMPEVLHVSWR